MLKSFKFNPLYLIPLIPFSIYIVLLFPFFGDAPALDPMIIYRDSTRFFMGGVQEIAEYDSKVHPPLIHIVNYISFILFGKNPASTNIIGGIILLFNSFFLFSILKKVFNIKIATSTTLLLFLNPYSLVNSFNFSNEMLMLTIFIFSTYFYTFDKKILLSFSLALTALTKETALVIPISLFIVMVIEKIYSEKKAINKFTEIIKVIPIFIPTFLVFLGWMNYVKSIGATEWRDTTFVKTNDSSFHIVLNNFLTLRFINEFLMGNLKNSLFFNFQWVFTLSTIILLLSKKIKLETLQQKRFFFSVVAFGIFYILFVFSFPTWTIPRYVLPLLFPLFLLLSIGLEKLKFYKFFLFFLISISLIASISSRDPLSSKNGYYKIFNETFYVKDFWNDGPDGIEYNLQFLKPVKEQNKIILFSIHNNADYIITNCNELKFGERIWSISIHNDFYGNLIYKKELECINYWDIENSNKIKFKNKYVLILKSEKEKINTKFFDKIIYY